MAKKNIAKSYNFKVFFDIFPSSFSKISGLEKGIEVEQFAEGGVNDRAVSLLTPVTAEKTMTFERGVTTEASLFSILGPGASLSKEISIFMLDDSGTVFRSMFLMGCTVKNVTWGELNAGSSEIWIERLEVLYNYLDIVNTQLTL